MQGFLTRAFSVSTAVSSAARSASESGLKSRKVEMLSITCDASDIPLRMTFTFGSEPTKRIAHDASDCPGVTAARRAETSAGSFASRPPLTGSITTTGTPFSAASR